MSEISGDEAISRQTSSIQYFSDVMHAWKSTRGKSKSYRYIKNAFSVCIVLFVLVLFLTTFALQTDPGRYVSSYTAISDTFETGRANDISSTSEIYDWLDDIMNRIGGKTARRINIVCQYDDPPAKDVSIDGNIVNIRDPATPTHACQLDSQFFGTTEAVTAILAGNNQLLSFGIFYERAYSQDYDEEQGVNLFVASESNVDGKTRAKKDPKFIEMAAERDSGGGLSYICVLSDAFAGKAQTTLGWNGTVKSGKQAFHSASSVNIGGEVYRPCFSVSSNDELETFSKNYTVKDIDEMFIAYVWMSSAKDVYTECFEMLNEPTPFMAYLSMISGSTDVLETGFYSQCTKLLELSADRFVGRYETDKLLFPDRLTEYDIGSFISVSSEVAFVEDSGRELYRQRIFDIFDRNTRSMKMYVISRNLGDGEQFYAETLITFAQDSTGKVSFDFDISYVPILHTTYGFRDSKITNYNILALECTLLVIFAIFGIREVWQLRYRARKIHRCLHEVLDKHHINFLYHFECCVLKQKISPNEGTAQDDEQEALGTAGHKKLPSVADLERGVQVMVDEEEEDGGGGQVCAGENDEDIAIPDTEHVPDSKKSRLWSPDTSPIYDVLDWGTIVVIVFCVAYRIQYIYLARDFHEVMKDLDLSNSKFDDNLRSIIEDIDRISDVESYYVEVVTIGIIIGVMQFFRYISFDAQLAIVTSTVYHSIAALVPVLLVFLTVLMCYGVTGMALYGSKLSSWSTLDKSLNSLFFFVLGEVGGYEDMKDVTTVGTLLFFWSYIVVILFILFNMVLAVIMAVYEEKVADCREHVTKKTV